MIISKKVIKAISRIEGISDSVIIRITLKNYDNKFYYDIHKKIKKLKIDYNNLDGWFGVENALIDYFQKRNVDTRLLDVLRYFLKNGLSSTSRYKIVRILKSFNSLSDEEVRTLKYDANYKIRDLLKNNL